MKHFQALSTKLAIGRKIIKIVVITKVESQEKIGSDQDWMLTAL